MVALPTLAGCFQVRYGIDVASLGEWAEPGMVVDAAQSAEAAGWDALLLWDHLGYVWGRLPPTHGWSWLQLPRPPCACAWAQRSRRCLAAARQW